MDIVETTQPTSTLRARDWLRQRMSPRGENVMMLACYGTILAALVAVILQRRADLPAWRFYSVIVALSVLLALNVVLDDLEKWLGMGARWLYFAVASGLFLVGFWLSGSGALFYLMFMLSAQSFVMLRFRSAFLYSLTMMGLLLALLHWGLNSSNLSSIALSLLAGLFFTSSFSVVLVRYAEQTKRATDLLQQLQTANVALEMARERERDLAVAEERVRLARDIHDGLGHHLAVLSVQLQAASKLLDRDPPRAAQALTVCREEVNAALDEVRHSVAAMRRSPLDGRTLDEALHTLVRDFDQRAALSATFVADGTPWQLAPAASQTLFRAAQEGLTNAQKHSAAHNVAVSLRYTASVVQLLVADDGRAASPSADGFGLAGIRERAEQLGGTCRADTQPNGGFRLEVTLPPMEEIV